MVIFFTLPPSNVDYPYVLINARRPDDGIRYLLNHRGVVRAVIIDSGIEVFRDPSVKEYPEGAFNWIRRQVSLYRRVKAIVPRADVYVTCPDYCDDHHPKALWINDDFTNIERTVINVVTCIDYFHEVPWLVPVQGWFRKPESLLICLEYYEQLGILDRCDYLAIANLCNDKSCEIVERSVKTVHRWLKERGYEDKKLHVFDLSLRCVERIKHYIHSFDTMAWTRPVSTELRRRYPFSAKTSEQRKLFFEEWLRQLERKVSSKSRSILEFLGGNR